MAYKTSVDITGYKIVLYNGNGGVSYSDTSLDVSTKTSTGSIGFAVLNYAANGIQNGDPDGIALVDASNNVIQFLSYEGVFTATNGPANGIGSIIIGKAESSSTAAGLSLQLTGTGCGYSSFVWSDPLASTIGLPNRNQVICSQVRKQGVPSRPSFSYLN